jgi:hypothetical protein
LCSAIRTQHAETHPRDTEYSEAVTSLRTYTIRMG